MRNSAVFYLTRNDVRTPGGLDKYDDYGVLLAGGECEVSDVNLAKKLSPGKLVAAYLLVSDLPQTLKGYPGAFANYVGGAPFVVYGKGSPNPLHHVGLLSDATVKWTVEQAQLCVGDADILMLDCFSPKNCSWAPGVSFDGSGKATTQKVVTENWTKYVLLTVAALHEAMPDVMLVCNTGHGVNPSMVQEPLRSIYREFCSHVNGIGYEEGKPLTPAAWGGPFRRPGLSLFFTASELSFARAMNEMIFPPNVVPAMRSWLVK